MSRRRSRKLRHTRRLRHNPKLVKGALTVVSVNTYRLAWAARAYEAILKNGGKPPKWLLDEKGKIPSFGVLSESAWGKMDSPDGLTWMEGIVDLFDRAIRSRGRLRVGQWRPAMWEDRELGTERMDTLPARLMGSAAGGSLLFVVGGKWIAEEGKAPAGQDWYAQIFPFFPNNKAAMDAIALAYKITGANQIQFLLPDPPGTEAPKRDILGVDAFEAYMGGGPVFPRVALTVTDKYSGKNAEDRVLSGQKRLTTRRQDYDLAPGKTGVTMMKGRKVYATNLGLHTFQEAISRFGGLPGFMVAEGFSPTSLPGGPMAKWEKGTWPDKSGKAYLFQLSTEPPDSPKVRERKASAKVDWAEAAERLRLSPKMPTVLYPREAFHRYYGVADPKDIEAQQIAAKRWYNAKIIANSTAFIQALRPPGKTSGGIFGYHLPALEELARKHKSKEAARLDKLLRVHVVQEAMGARDEGAVRAWEREAQGPVSRSFKRIIPWEAVERVALVAYGYRPASDDFGPLVPQPVVLPGQSIFKAYERALSAVGGPVNPLVALVAGAAGNLGLAGAIARAKDQASRGLGLPLPFVVVASVVVCPKVKTKQGIRTVGWRPGVGLPDALVKAAIRAPDLEDCPGSNHPMKALLAELYLPQEIVEYESKTGRIKKFAVPNLDPSMDLETSPWRGMAVVDRKDTAPLSRYVVGVDVEENGRFARTPMKGGLFSRSMGLVTKSETYAFAKSRAEGKKRKDGLTPDQVAYYYAVNRGLGNVPRRKAPEVAAGMAAKAAVGGMGQQAKRTSGGVAARRMGEHITSQQRDFDSIYAYASRLLGETEEKQRESGFQRSDVHPDYGIPVDLLRAMHRAGVKMPKKRDAADVRRALRDLKKTVQTAYQYQPEHGKLREEGRRGEYLAQLNPNGRRPRKPRRNRGGNRHNPQWTDDQAKEVAKWLESQEGAPDVPLEETRAELFEEGIDITPGVHGLFHTRSVKDYTERTTRRVPGAALGPKDFTVERRFASDMAPAAGRVIGELVPPAEVTDPVLISAYTTESYPWRAEGGAGESALGAVTEQLPLSAKEVQEILNRQAASRSGRPAMQASSALCAMHRTQKLDYALPPGLADMVGKDTLILMSPEAEDPRVMTYKRGVHMDCDMEGPFMGKILGVALQAALLWYAAKPSRRVGGRLWVSRVGDDTAILVWSSRMASDPISLKAVARNLRGGALQPFGEVYGESAEGDKKRYSIAVDRLAGKTSKRMRRRAAERAASELPLPPDDGDEPTVKGQGAKPAGSPAGAGTEEGVVVGSGTEEVEEGIFGLGEQG